MTLGLIDSGLGGIGVLKAINERFDQQSVICLADQLNAPYGNKDIDELINISKANVNWLIKQGVDEVLLACNTTSSVALPALKEAFPKLKITGIISLTCESLINSNYSNILVLATKATVKSNSYVKELQKIIPNTKVYQKALTELALLIENNTDAATIETYLMNCLNEFQGKVEAILLGCTHYPLVSDSIKSILNVPIYDSNQAIKEYKGISNNDINPEIKIYTTKDPEMLEKQIKDLYNLSYLVKKAII